jgi:manganese-dependent ADP-ribose/CDP-alcohol diphosphatase
MKHVLCILMVCITSTTFAESAPFSFGVIADSQYCNVETTGVRHYKDSPAKLRACVDQLNMMDLDFSVHLGDFIDKDWESFDVVGPIFASLNHPAYHVLGNHDYSVADDKKAQVHTRMGLPSRYYDFAVKGWRFVALDGNDVSFHAYPKDSVAYKAAEKYYVDHKITSPKWNGAIGETQLEWLQGVLDDATKKGESVVLMAHFPVYPENVHNLWNAETIVSMIDANPCVKAYINGHNHSGNYGEKNGVHYVTFKGMVDTADTAYSTVEVTEDALRITGFGRQENQTLTIRKSGVK